MLCEKPWNPLKLPNWVDSSEGKLFHCDLGIALQVLLWVIHGLFFKVPKKMQFMKAEQEAKPLGIENYRTI